MNPMKEYKTYTDGLEGDFDRGVNALVTEGWIVDSRQFGVNSQGDVLIAFLSREIKVKVVKPTARQIADKKKTRPILSSRKSAEESFQA